MSLALEPQSAPAANVPSTAPAATGRAGSTFGYLKRNRSLVIGVGLLGALALFILIGHLTVDVGDAAPMSAGSLDSPSRALPFGSDKQGRNLYAVMVEGTPLTLRLGLIAGAIGLIIGATVGFIAGYYGGPVDAVLRVIIDVGLTIPALLILVVLAMRNTSGMSVNQMTFAISCLAWLYPARIVRAQVLTLKERGYVQIAKLSGMTGREVIYKELLPNLLPYLVAGLVGSISAAVLAAIGLEMLGLGPFEAPTLGMTLYWVNYNAAIINGWWWWWVPPIVIIAILFTGLFLTAVGLDELANPRLRNRV